MVESKQQQIKNDGIYRVRDTINILATLFFTAVIGLFTAYSNINFIHGIFLLSIDDVFLGIIFISVFNLLLFGASYRLRAIWDGVKLDLNERTIEFGGGGVAANDMSDYVKLEFLLQYFRRTKINLDDVSHMEMTTTSTRRYNETTKSWSTSYKYQIQISGTFGAASIPFSSEGKCNELYTAIRQINRMGSPITFA